MRTLAFMFVLFVLNSMCFGQTSQTGTKRIMIKGQMVEVPVFTTKGEGKTYYDTHPEERAIDAANQANKPIRDMQEKLIEDMKTREQGYGSGSYRDYSSPSPPPPSSSVPPPPSGLIGTRSGAIDSQTGDFYPGVKGGIINPQTGEFVPDVGGGYIDPKTGRFIPKQ
jgi:hypothetical protein